MRGSCSLHNSFAELVSALPARRTDGPSSGLRPPSPHLKSDGEKALEFGAAVNSWAASEKSSPIAKLTHRAPSPLALFARGEGGEAG